MKSGMEMELSYSLAEMSWEIEAWYGNCRSVQLGNRISIPEKKRISTPGKE